MLIIENYPNYFKMVVKFIGGIKISINKSGKERMVDTILLAFGHTLSMLAFFGSIRLHQIYPPTLPN